MLSRVQPFAIPWTVAHQAPLSMKFSRQECWIFPPISFSRASSLARDQTWVSRIAGRFFTSEHQGSPWSSFISRAKRNFRDYLVYLRLREGKWLGWGHIAGAEPDANVFSNLGILTQGPKSSPWLNFIGVHKTFKTLSKIKHVSLCVCIWVFVCVCMGMCRRMLIAFIGGFSVTNHGYNGFHKNG